jgi:Zn finger protein HypA/HybF involved in hydrogenase expression
MITLVCWQCGKFYEMDEDPQTIYFGFHLSELTIKAGWKSYHDDDHGRLLIFCSEKCAEKARKKNGRFRLRAKKLVTKCPWCFGTGTIQYPHRDKLDKCPACGGKGSGTWYQDDISPPKVACSDALLSELGKPKKVTP